MLNVGQPQRDFLVRKGWVIVVLMVTFIAAMLSKIERLPNADEVFQLCQLDTTR